jgi:hypothetical protein
LEKNLLSSFVLDEISSFLLFPLIVDILFSFFETIFSSFIFSFLDEPSFSFLYELSFSFLIFPLIVDILFCDTFGSVLYILFISISVLFLFIGNLVCEYSIDEIFESFTFTIVNALLLTPQFVSNCLNDLKCL